MQKNAFKPATGTTEGEELNNVENSENKNDSDSIGEEGSGSDKEESNAKGISREESEDDLSSWRVESACISEKCSGLLCISY